MTIQKSRWLLAFTIITAAVAVGILYHHYNDDELSVYVAMLDEYKPLPEMKDVVFMSATTTCHTSRASEFLKTDLFKALEQANKAGTSPRPLERLSSLANIVSWKTTKRIHLQDGYVPGGRLAGKRIVKVSRVGFNKTHTKAVLCLEPGGSGSLLFFERDSGFTWHLVGEQPAWIS